MHVHRADLVIERRAKVMAALVWVCFVSLFVRLWVLQIIRGPENYRRSLEYTTYDIPIPAPRGVFYDRHGRLLMGNRAGYNVVGLLDRLKRDPALIARLARQLGSSLEAIRVRLATPGIPPCQLYPVAKDVPLRVALRIQESLDLPGVEVQEVSLRNYKYGDFATHLFGYIREISQEELKDLFSAGYQIGEMIGKTGLEKTLERYLRGENGLRRLERDRAQRPVRELLHRDPVPGHDAWLTIDFNVQKAAEEALRERLVYLRKYTKYRRARAGAVVALDPRTGEILAMASQPSFDPNLFVDVVPPKVFAALNADPDKPFNNRVLRGLYPPASTFKPFVVYAALREGAVRPGEVFFCHGVDRVYGEKARCWTVHGRQTVVEGLKNSCNVMFYELGRRLGVEKLAYYAGLFGFGRPTGLELAPGEAKGIVPDPVFKARLRPNDPWRELETLHFAIGQGYLEVTPLQLAVAYAALANGGRLLRPSIVREIRTFDGRPVRRFPLGQVVGRVPMNKEIREIILAGLNEVVTGGTAAGAFAGFPLDRIPVAGKTGTGQRAGADDYSLFACFAPADDPQIVVVVVIEQGGSGSIGAAPVARRVLEAFFGIEPFPYAPRKGAPQTAREEPLPPSSTPESPDSSAPEAVTAPSVSAGEGEGTEEG
ncbi:MAG: penicillin-binding protein 2 [Bacillota bacterium]